MDLETVDPARVNALKTAITGITLNYDNSKFSYDFENGWGTLFVGFNAPRITKLSDAAYAVTVYDPGFDIRFEASFSYEDGKDGEGKPVCRTEDDNRDYWFHESFKGFVINEDLERDGSWTPTGDVAD